MVRLATKLILAPDKTVPSEKGLIRTIYDPARGLLDFISDAIDQINKWALPQPSDPITAVRGARKIEDSSTLVD